jgi:hypothetical protein
MTRALRSAWNLRDVLLPDVVVAVLAGNLFPEFDLEQRLDGLAQNDRQTQRGQELIRAWLAPHLGRAQ